MERPNLELVVDNTRDFETPAVTEIRRSRLKIDMAHIRAIGSLPDNVYLFPVPEPPDAA